MQRMSKSRNTTNIPDSFIWHLDCPRCGGEIEATMETGINELTLAEVSDTVETAKSEWEADPFNYLIKLINEHTPLTKKYEEIGIDWSWVQDETPEKKAILEERVTNLVDEANRYAIHLHQDFRVDEKRVVKELIERINYRKQTQPKPLRSGKPKN